MNRAGVDDEKEGGKKSSEHLVEKSIYQRRADGKWDVQDREVKKKKKSFDIYTSLCARIKRKSVGVELSGMNSGYALCRLDMLCRR